MSLSYADPIDTFESKESTLINSFEDFLIQNSSTKPTLILREMDCWQGRADVVEAFFTSHWSLPRGSEEVLSRLGPAQILSVLYPKKKQKLNTIVSLSGLSESTVRKHLKELSECGLVQQDNQDRFTIHPQVLLPQIRFHAYEGKLHNWKRALYQAINYLGFAHYSSVVMPARYIKPALENLEHFKINGIGLISVSENEYKMILKPRKNRPRKKAFHLVGIGKTIMELNSNVRMASKDL
ncbi:helix-turn-helix domain-containing protein [Cohnella hashimotonis]|uniref:Helix-turn-helix domain-containing protein n=1 Tax=Cohnella hashimotonis TaxID=2826895 RepID=A0ABT6TS94_9BACL|nr:helix-turn-helix domain-containing protein [Cohnella hashimotonis]MDI4649589.1 helix-turn-helix domain-containing protein [Cohnella hashimotonis]